MDNDVFDLNRRYVAAGDGGAAREIPVDERFWPDLMSGKHPELERGWLVATYPMTSDWTHWEMHPEGEEILTLLSGALELILDENGVERRVRLGAGQSFVMPRGAWHRALVAQPCLMLAMTYGRNTQHRPL